MHIDHILNAVDRVFKRRCDDVGDRLRIRAAICSVYDDLRRRKLRILLDGGILKSQNARDYDDYRNDAGKDGAVDEKFRKHYFPLSALL